jgi:hypothetical protein
MAKGRDDDLPCRRPGRAATRREPGPLSTQHTFRDHGARRDGAPMFLRFAFARARADVTQARGPSLLRGARRTILEEFSLCVDFAPSPWHRRKRAPDSRPNGRRGQLGSRRSRPASRMTDRYRPASRREQAAVASHNAQPFAQQKARRAAGLSHRSVLTGKTGGRIRPPRPRRRPRLLLRLRARPPWPGRRGADPWRARLRSP